MVEAKQIRGVAKMGQATIDFGSTENGDAEVVLTGLLWVEAGSTIICTVMGDRARLQGVLAGAEDLVPGVGFTIRAHAPMGARGTFTVNWIGA